MINYFGLIGKDISYSRSPEVWNIIWKERDIRDCIFQLFDTSEPKTLIQNTLKSGLNWKGLMVTTPYKTVLTYEMGQLTDTAKGVGAINAIKIIGKNLVGHNTDIGGFIKSIEGIDVGTKVLVLGSGGASKAVQVALKAMGKEVLVVSRNPKNGMLPYEKVSSRLVRSTTMIVNATPLGGPNYPHLRPKIPYEAVTKDHILYDLSYSNKSGFLDAVKVSCKKLDGRKMLYHQACLAYDFFMP